MIYRIPDLWDVELAKLMNSLGNFECANEQMGLWAWIKIRKEVCQ